MKMKIPYRSPKYHKITAFVYFVIGINMTFYGFYSTSNMIIVGGLIMGGLAGFRWWLYKKAKAAVENTASQ